MITETDGLKRVRSAIKAIMQAEKEKVIKWLNENCDNSKEGHWNRGSELNGWEFGSVRVFYSSSFDSIGAYSDYLLSVYFEYTELTQLQEFIITENEKADRNSLIHRLFK